MFVHHKNGKVNYSIREKINYYQSIVDKKRTDVPAATKRKAPLRLKTLKKLNARTFDDPELIATDDRHFGNPHSKPRLCVVTGVDSKGRLRVSPVLAAQSKTVVLDKTPSREVGVTGRFKNTSIDRSDVYETKIVSNPKPLTHYDKVKIRNLFPKK